jgi:hypothetical protein
MGRLKRTGRQDEATEVDHGREIRLVKKEDKRGARKDHA